MRLSNKTYDMLKWVAQILLPALGTLYFALSSIWGLPYADKIVGTITAVDAFLGIILGISTTQYSNQYTNSFEEAKKSLEVKGFTVRHDESKIHSDDSTMELATIIVELKKEDK